MALVPSGHSAEELVLCEWRLFISPECPYHRDLLLINQFSVYYFWISSAIVALLMFVRIKVFKYPLLRSGPWYLRLMPMETGFVAPLVNQICRGVHASLLLYAPHVGLFWKNFSFTLGHSIATCGIVYFWICLVKAVPRERIIDTGGQYHDISRANVAIGAAMIAILLQLTWLEGLSAQFTFTSLHTSNTILTVSYSFWTLCMATVSISVQIFGNRILSVLRASIKFHQDNALQHHLQVRELQRSCATLKPLIFFVSSVSASAATSILVVNVARYYIWSSRVWSLIFCVLFYFTSGGYCFAIPLYIFIKDLFNRRKDRKDSSLGNDPEVGAANHRSSHSMDVALSSSSRKKEDAADMTGLHSDSKTSFLVEEDTKEQILDKFLDRNIN